MVRCDHNHNFTILIHTFTAVCTLSLIFFSVSILLENSLQKDLAIFIIYNPFLRCRSCLSTSPAKSSIKNSHKTRQTIQQPWPWPWWASASNLHIEPAQDLPERDTVTYGNSIDTHIGPGSSLEDLKSGNSTIGFDPASWWMKWVVFPPHYSIVDEPRSQHP